MYKRVKLTLHVCNILRRICLGSQEDLLSNRLWSKSVDIKPCPPGHHDGHCSQGWALGQKMVALLVICVNWLRIVAFEATTAWIAICSSRRIGPTEGQQKWNSEATACYTIKNLTIYLRYLLGGDTAFLFIFHGKYIYFAFLKIEVYIGNSLVVQWLGLGTFTDKGLGSILGQ